LGSISKLRAKPFQRIEKNPPSNICCELCFGSASCISICEPTYTIVCKACSVYSDKLISINWLNLLQLSENLETYERRIEILSELDLKCQEISESFDSFIINLTQAYNKCKREIDLNTTQNLNYIEQYEQDLLRRFSEVVVSRDVLKTEVFIKNLEILQDQIIELNLLTSDELKQTIMENLSISFRDVEDFRYLI